jgi:hypothetical protein
MTLVLLFAAALQTAGAPQTAPVNKDAAALVEFMKRATAYEALQRRLDATLSEVARDGTPAQFIDHQRALARMIQRERIGARPGDIFTKDTRGVMRRLLAGVLRGPDGADIKKGILDEFTSNVRLTVNGQYPENVPLSPMPLQILQALPKLPSILEYRFIGRNLILLDAHARVIVDYVDKAFR